MKKNESFKNRSCGKIKMYYMWKVYMWECVKHESRDMAHPQGYFRWPLSSCAAFCKAEPCFLPTYTGNCCAWTPCWLSLFLIRSCRTPHCYINCWSWSKYMEGKRVCYTHPVVTSLTSVSHRIDFEIAQKHSVPLHFRSSDFQPVLFYPLGTEC